MTQADCSSRDSRLSAHCSAVLTASQYLCTEGGDVDSGCMRLQVRQSSAPPCIASAKVLTFFFCFFYGYFITEKRKENENADVFFS